MRHGSEPRRTSGGQAILDAPAQDVAAAEEPTRQFTMDVVVHVYPQHGRWFAASTDLAVMAEADSPRMAIHRFVEAADAYISTALDHGWVEAIGRRPPLKRRWEIRLRVRWAKLRRRRPLTVSKLLDLGQTHLRLA